MRPRVGILCLLAAFAAGGCAEAKDSASPDGDSGNDDFLAGATFVSTNVMVAGRQRPLVDGTRAVIGFVDEGITLEAGCNSMSGQATYADGRLTVDRVGGTEMGCAQARMDQDAWLARFLAEDPDYQLDGDVLALTAGDLVIELTAQ